MGENPITSTPSANATRPALVTGVTGFVGANVARALLARGREVRAFVRPGSDRRNVPTNGPIELREGDLRDAASIQEAIRGCGEVYHVAADYRYWSSTPSEIHESNVRGTTQLLESAAKAGVSKIVYTSSTATIGLNHTGEPTNEDTVPLPGQFSGHYKRSKLDAEKIALEFARRGLPVVIVNPAAPIGPWDRKPTPTGKIIVDFMNGDFPAYSDTGLCFIDVRDVALGHVLAAEKGRIGERYILGNRNLSLLQFLELLAPITGQAAPKWKIPYAAAWLAGIVSTGYSSVVSKRPPRVPLEAVRASRYRMFYDSGKAVRELGLPQTPIETAAAAAVEWFKNQTHGNSEASCQSP